MRVWGKTALDVYSHKVHSKTPYFFRGKGAICHKKAGGNRKPLRLCSPLFINFLFIYKES